MNSWYNEGWKVAIDEKTFDRRREALVAERYKLIKSYLLRRRRIQDAQESISKQEQEIIQLESTLRADGGRGGNLDPTRRKLRNARESLRGSEEVVKRSKEELQRMKDDLKKLHNRLNDVEHDREKAIFEQIEKDIQL